MPSNAYRYHRLQAALLAVLLTFQSVGWFLAWDLAQVGAHDAAQQELAQEKTPDLRLTLPAVELPSLRVGAKEIRWNGHLYDVRRAQVFGDSVRLELYHDAKEEALCNTLCDVLFASSNHSGPLPHPQMWLAKWLGACFLHPGIATHFPIPVAGQSARALFSYLFPTPQSAPGIFSPPPELA